jgi:hypothetical protein
MEVDSDEVRRTLRPRRSVLPDLKDVLPREKAPPKTAAQRMKEFRERQKKSADDYKDYRDKETARIKSYRKSISEEAKQRSRETHAAYMRTYRAEQKEKAKSQTKDTVKEKGRQVVAAVPVKIMTRKEKKAKRSCWKEAKRETRKNMTQAQKDAVNTRRCEKYALKKAQALLDKLLPNGHAPPFLVQVQMSTCMTWSMLQLPPLPGPSADVAPIDLQATHEEDPVDEEPIYEIFFELDNDDQPGPTGSDPLQMTLDDKSTQPPITGPDTLELSLDNINIESLLASPVSDHLQMNPDEIASTSAPTGSRAPPIDNIQTESMPAPPVSDPLQMQMNPDEIASTSAPTGSRAPPIDNIQTE